MIPPQHFTVEATPRRGRPVLGGIAGFFLGFFLWIDLILIGTLPLESGLGYALPILGLAGGIALAMWAPFGGRSDAHPKPDSGGAVAPTSGPDDDQPNASMTSDGA